MFRRQLQALHYPEYQVFDDTDEKQFRSVILWLEEQHIRQMKAADRQPLRRIGISHSSDQWQAAYSAYIKVLKCPHPANERRSCLAWLLSRAVSLAYRKNLDKYRKLNTSNGSSSGDNKKANPLVSRDFSSEECVATVNRLASLLQVTQHPDHLVTLSAVCQVIADHLGTAKQNGTDKSQRVKIPLERVPLPGPEDGKRDDHGARAERVFRLLYNRDLRSLQTEINQIIVAVQSMVADPRTDTSLGQTGY